MPVHSRLTVIQIISQRKAFYRQIIPKSSCARKETVDNILVTSRNGDRKIMQTIRITSRTLEYKKVEPVEPIQMKPTKV